MLLELQNLGKSFGEHEVLRDVNAGVERGDRIGIIGANGTGKTRFCGSSAVRACPTPEMPRSAPV